MSSFYTAFVETKEGTLTRFDLVADTRKVAKEVLAADSRYPTYIVDSVDLFSRGKLNSQMTAETAPNQVTSVTKYQRTDVYTADCAA